MSLCHPHHSWDVKHDDPTSRVQGHARPGQSPGTACKRAWTVTAPRPGQDPQSGLHGDRLTYKALVSDSSLTFRAGPTRTPTFHVDPDLMAPPRPPKDRRRPGRGSPWADATGRRAHVCLWETFPGDTRVRKWRPRSRCQQREHPTVRDVYFIK